MSFEHIFGACAEHFEIPGRPVEALLSRIRAGSRETPFMFSLHFQLLEAIEQDRLDDVQVLISRILSLGPAAPGILQTSLTPDEFPWDREAIASHFAAEHDSAFRYVAPAADAIPARQVQVSAALELLRQAVPGLAAELEEIATTVILARAVPLEDESGPVTPFQGASALRAFGAIMVDAEIDPSLVDCATTLIHEEAHNALFALSPMEGVVSNTDDELHSSPLRDDPRPLEGIYHATFVLARMIYGMETLLGSGLLSSEDRDIAIEILETARPQFFEGLATVRRYGQLTPAGAAALEAAESYMAAFA